MRSKFKWIYALIFGLIIQFSFAQEKTITGIIYDSNGLILPGVNIIIKQTKINTQSDLEGKFTIKASEGNKIEFTFVGYMPKVITVGKSNDYKISMESDSQLEEVVVIGYGTQKKKEVTSSLSRIKGESLIGLVTPSFESQLAGRASGVQVTTSNGILGAGPKVRIRGTASISSGTDPLYVVDGMPIYTGDLGGFASANALGDINPNDIESFEVLKDGAATAIYGSRGANGVILITTKKGKKGDMKVSYNSVAGYASAVETFDLLNTEQFLVISNEKRTNRSQAAWAVGNQYDTDWQSAVLKSKALQIEHNFSLSGGNEKTKYFMSLGYNTQEGVAVSNEMSRYTFRTNLEHKVNDWLSVGANLALSRTEYSGLNTGRNSLSGNMFNAIRQLPNTPIYDANNPTGYNINLATGNVGQGTNTDPVGDNISNIAYVLDFNKFQSKIQRSIVNVFASAELYKGLNYKFQASVDNPITGGFLYYNPIHGDGRGSNGRLQNDNTDLTRWNTQNILTYNNTFLNDHTVSATGVLEYQKEKNQYFVGVGTNLLNEFYNQNLVSGSYGTQESGGSVTETGLISYVGRLSYNYKQKYFLQGSIRRDGLSKFNPATRWENFTGYSAGWSLSKEKFMSRIVDIVSDLKIRASYSEVGNTEVGTYPYLGLTSASQYGALNGIAFTQFGNDALAWETSKKTDFGVDISLLNNKIKLTFDYFNNDIDNMILAVPVAPSLGVPNNRINKNIGKLYNKGYEFSAEFDVLNKGNFKWNVNANVTFQKNVVTKLPNNGADIVGGSSSDVNISPNIIIRQGESVNSLYGFVYWGVNSANGFPVYVKADGSLVQQNVNSGAYTTFDSANPSVAGTASSLLQSDKKILGNTLPKYFGGFSSKMTYKNFDLTFLVRFSGGNKLFNSTRRELLTQNLNNNSTEILGRWQSVTNPGDGWTPILWASSNTTVNNTSNASTRFVENGDFISLDNITLGYNLPKSLTNKIKIDNLRLFIQGQNMLMITKYKGLNPEMETFGVDLNGTPRAKIFSLGLNVNL